MTVYHLLSDLVSGTMGYTWIQTFDRSQNGQAAWLTMIKHYEGGVLDHERANEQSHAIAVRLKANHGQTESEGKKDLIQAKRNRFE